MGIFVGRDHELRALDALLDAALAGEGNVAVVSGEPGVGRTRLVEELTRRAEARGFVVGWGRSWEGEGTLAYYPWLQALRRLRGSFGPPFDAACAESPELAVLLDLHAADVSTLQMLHFIARHAREGARLNVAGTMRDTSLHGQPEVRQLIARIGQRDPPSVVVPRPAALRHHAARGRGDEPRRSSAPPDGTNCGRPSATSTRRRPSRALALVSRFRRSEPVQRRRGKRTLRAGHLILRFGGRSLGSSSDHYSWGTRVSLLRAP